MDQIHLANRLGRLQGDVSPIQKVAVAILISHERASLAKDSLREFGQPARQATSAPQEVAVDDDPESLEVEFDTPGTWKMPEMDSQDVMKVLRGMGTTGTVTDDLTSEG